MFIPKSKYTEPKYTRGDLLNTSKGAPYTGWYFVAYGSDYYAGKEPLPTTEELTLRVTKVATPPKKFRTKLIAPTEIEFKEGSFSRYFIQDKRTTKIIETDKANYKYFINLPYTVGAVVEWNLSKPAEDIMKGPYVYYGSITRNRELIENAEKTIRGLSTFIKSYKEFVE